MQRTPQGYSAFIPAPLPPAFQYSPDLVLALSRADAVLSELSGLGRNLPNPHLLITPYVRREAVLSSRIEGTQSDLADLLLDEAIGRREPTPDTADVREVGNYVYVTAIDGEPIFIYIYCAATAGARIASRPVDEFPTAAFRALPQFTECDGRIIG